MDISEDLIYMVQVSVIVPVYNLEDQLDACLSCLVKQTHTQLQIILVDDGSKDNSLTKCKEWAEKDARFEVYHHSNHGVSYTRNVGLEYARGDYVMFVDGDDLVALDMIERYVSLAEAWQTDVVVGGIQLHHVDGRVERQCPKMEGVLSPEQLMSMLCQKEDTAVYGYVPNKIYRRTFLEENHIRFCEQMAAQEDLHFALQAYAKVKAIGCTSYTGYEYKYIPNKRTVPTGDLIGNQMCVLRLAREHQVAQKDIDKQIQKIQSMVYGGVYWAKSKVQIQEIAQLPGVNTVIQEYTQSGKEVRWCMAQLVRERYGVLCAYFGLRRGMNKLLRPFRR